jgi:hypothetical protein
MPNPPSAGAADWPPAWPPTCPTRPPAHPPRTMGTRAWGSPILGTGAAMDLLGMLPSTKFARNSAESTLRTEGLELGRSDAGELLGATHGGG